MMVLQKRQVVLVTLVIMILVAGYLNWSYKHELDSIPTMGDGIELAAQKNLGEAQLVENRLVENDAIERKEQFISTNRKGDYFIETRMERERARSEALEVMQSIVDNSNSPKESKTIAQNEMIKIAKVIEKEVVIENLIKAKGFKEAVVLISEGYVNIIVQSNGLIPSQVAQITDITISQTGVDANHIKIMEVKAD